jgi:ABC-type taurine transport system ATPase subunit
MMGVAPSTPATPADIKPDQRHVAISGAIIQAVNVSKVYQSSDGEKVSALTSLNLEVSENEFLVIVGPSGCGKSTLLKLIVGLLPVTDGIIYFHDQPVLGPRTDVGMVFREPVLLPWRTVRQNVLSPIEILKRKDRDYIEESDRLLTLVGLSGFDAIRAFGRHATARRHVQGSDPRSYRSNHGRAIRRARCDDAG